MPSAKRYAYTTLITRANYLAGVVILAYTLRKHGSQYPLIVLYTPSLKPEAVKALELLADKLNIVPRKCELLLPPKNVKTWLIAERFTDTWTKLRVFEVFNYETVCYLDADMAIFNRNMDCVFELGTKLPADQIAANHACVCNKEKDEWAPAEWNEQNCGFTPLEHPSALTSPTPVTADSRPTYHLLNSGMFLYHPSEELWDRMLHFFNTTPLLSKFKFPDQDFLAEFFRNRWQSMGWQFNALKTMRYWHTNIWRDDEVICLHYIVDKPWAARIGPDGKAGYKGNDGVTHSWWWEEYQHWIDDTRKAGPQSEEVLGIVAKFVAKPLGQEDDSEADPDMQAIGANVQAFAKNKSPDREDEPEGDKQTQPSTSEATDQPKAHDNQIEAHHQPEGGFRRRIPGEKGHGPVVHKPRPHGMSEMIQ